MASTSGTNNRSAANNPINTAPTPYSFPTVSNSAGTYKLGIATTKPFFDLHLGASGIEGELMVKTIGPNHFGSTGTKEFFNNVLALCCIRSMVAENTVRPNEATIASLSAGEILMSNLPDIMYNDILSVQTRINNLAIHLKAYFENNFIAYSNAKLVDFLALDDNATHFTANGATLTVFVKFVKYVGSMLKPDNNAFCSEVGLIVTTLISAAKKGTVSPGFVNKIETAVSSELGKTIILDVDAIRRIYTVYGSYITADNVEIIFEAWKDILPSRALRLNLTIQQMAGSGMTSFITIGRAIRLYVDFPWGNVERIVPAEFASYRQALSAVDGNRYWGFNQDIGAAKPTNFKNIAWVAKELLIAIEGDRALASYAGWTRAPKEYNTLKTLIDNYINNRTAQATAAGIIPLSNANSDIITTLNSNLYNTYFG